MASKRAPKKRLYVFRAAYPFSPIEVEVESVSLAKARHHLFLEYDRGDDFDFIETRPCPRGKRTPPPK